MMTDIQKRLFELQDTEYRDFTIKLNPTVDPGVIIGVRLPALKELAKELKGTAQAREFLDTLPHEYHDEYHLHCFLSYYITSFDEALRETERLMPYIDNWAVCDSIKTKAFIKNPEKLLPSIDVWLHSGKTYTIRFGIRCLMNYFLDNRFKEEYPQKVAQVISEEYYVNMMIAWYFATALAKQYDSAVKYLEDRKLSKWVHNKTIRKAIESYRVTDEHKAYLRTLTIK